MRASLHSRILVALLGVGALPGCVQVPTGERLCPAPNNPCACSSAERDPSRGSVVVRWRLADAQVGTVLPRATCCCVSAAQPLSPQAGQQCPNFGSKCPDTPAWLVRNVQLRIESVSGSFGPCVVSSPCNTGELTTEYCLPEGDYDLRLSADIEVYDPGCREFVCSGKQTVSPATFRRRIYAGRSTSLDGVILGINPPALFPAPGSSPDAGPSQCTAPTSDLSTN
jgi:hypothetical protein